VRALPPRRRYATTCESKRQRRRGQQEQHAPPPDAAHGCPGDENRSGDVADRAGRGPARHVPLAGARIAVHQRRLCEADEGSGCRVSDQERDEEGPEPDGRRAQGGRHGEPDAAEEDQRTSTRRVAGEPDQRIEGAADEPRDGEDEADLAVAQVQVAPDQRPGRRARAADELVEQLDREQNQDGAAGAAEERAELGAGAGHDVDRFSTHATHRASRAVGVTPR
jgi:hypothetical protein